LKSTFIDLPEPAIETFNKAVLLWHASSDIVPVQLGLISPVQNGVAGGRGAVITNNHFG
jgi:hypothetical protein